LSRVNHNTVKRLIAQKQKTITDRQFFTSRILAGHFADMAVAQTKRYGYNRRVKVRIVWETKNPQLACTNNDIIWINAGNKAITDKRSRQERYDFVCGLFAHELGHVLYTDFLMQQTYFVRFDAGKWYPEKPLLRNVDEKRHEADIWDFVSTNPKHKQACMRVMANIANVLEDGYIENKLINRYPGIFAYGISYMNEALNEKTPTLTESIEAEAENSHIWQSIMQLMVSYATMGEMKYGDEPLSDERIQTIFSLLDEIDDALIGTAKDRWNSVNTILIRCWPYIKDFIEFCVQKSEDAEASGDGTSLNDILSQILSELCGGSSEATGNSAPVAESPSKSGDSLKNGKKRAATAKSAAASQTENEDDESESGSGGKTPTPEEPESESGDSANASEGDPLDAGATGDEIQNVTAEETDRIPLVQTDELYAPSTGEFTVDDEYAGGGYANSAKDIERLLERVAENEVHKGLETKREAELNALANNIAYGDIHSGVNMRVSRITDVPDEMRDNFKSVAPKLLHISKQLQRSIEKQLQDKRRGGKQTGLLMGRRLDAHALMRNDGHVFYKNALPNENPEIAIGLLLDESGSMGGSDRATSARASAIIIYDFCRALNIPIMVYGHSTSRGGVDLYSYAEFEAIDRDDCYRMMDISSRGSNRDGAALRYVADQLSKRQEDIKLLILVSDGQPADHGYGGTAAEEDLRGIKHEYERKKILFVAAAIGSDKENIQRIYGDSFMDITDLNRLPVQLTEVVKRHIKV